MRLDDGRYRCPSCLGIYTAEEMNGRALCRRCFSQYVRKWQKQNPEKLKAYREKYQARLDREAVYMLTCSVCNKQFERRGRNGMQSYCNMQKGMRVCCSHKCRGVLIREGLMGGEHE